MSRSSARWPLQELTIQLTRWLNFRCRPWMFQHLFRRENTMMTRRHRVLLRCKVNLFRSVNTILSSVQNSYSRQEPVWGTTAQRITLRNPYRETKQPGSRSTKRRTERFTDKTQRTDKRTMTTMSLLNVSPMANLGSFDTSPKTKRAIILTTAHGKYAINPVRSSLKELMSVE